MGRRVKGDGGSWVAGRGSRGEAESGCCLVEYNRPVAMSLTRAQTLTILTIALPALLFALAIALHALADIDVDGGPASAATQGILIGAMLWSVPVFGTAALAAARPKGERGQRARGIALFGAGLLFGVVCGAGVAEVVTWDETAIGIGIVIGGPLALLSFYSLIRDGSSGQSLLAAAATIEDDTRILTAVVVLAIAGGFAGLRGTLFPNTLGDALGLLVQVFLGFLVATFVIGWIMGWAGKQRGEDLRMGPTFYHRHKWRSVEPSTIEQGWNALGHLPRDGLVTDAWECSLCGIAQARAIKASGAQYEAIVAPADMLRFDVTWMIGLAVQRVDMEPAVSRRRWTIQFFWRGCRWLPMSSVLRAEHLRDLGLTDPVGFIDAAICRDCGDTRMDFALPDNRRLAFCRVNEFARRVWLSVGLLVVHQRAPYPASDTMTPSWPSGTSSSPQPRTLP